MTRTEAFQLSILEGVCITHELLNDNIIIIIPGGNIVTEEGFEIPIWEFMKNRQSIEWETDWTIYK